GPANCLVRQVLSVPLEPVVRLPPLELVLVVLAFVARRVRIEDQEAPPLQNVSGHREPHFASSPIWHFRFEYSSFLYQTPPGRLLTAPRSGVAVHATKSDPAFAVDIERFALSQSLRCWFADHGGVNEPPREGPVRSESRLSWFDSRLLREAEKTE